ncbi:MAG: 2-succinyl-5-enolpyruvyl-6-hydroxy-3-cyclohexene-1-carboxylate synthase, partial [Bacteroidetes bacterium 38_7]
MSFDKKNIEILISLMSQHGITHVVISPGSRNAPAIILFQKSGLFRIIPIADERSAGFFALGMAQYLQRTVALLSTSGTAVLNYSPAIAEAYYQKIPLLIITADRPEELIDQGDGQTIHQRQVFDNFIRKSFHLSPIHTELEERHRVRIINEAIALTLYPVPGPIHINLPLAEPLYDLPSIENVHHYPIIQFVEGKTTFDDGIIQNWLSFNRKLLIVGQLHPDHPALPFLELMSKDPTTQIIAETTSNLFSSHVIINADLLLANLSEIEKHSIAPDLILTFGGNIISKNVKSFIRNLPLSIPHWRIGIDPQE